MIQHRKAFSKSPQMIPCTCGLVIEAIHFASNGSETIFAMEPTSSDVNHMAIQSHMARPLYFYRALSVSV